MPEQPEVRIMSNYFNYVIGHEKVIKVEKSPISKNKTNLDCLLGKEWDVFSKFRGKEMMVTLSSGNESYNLKIGFAKVGFLQFCDVNNLPSNFDEIAMLRFYTKSHVLFLSDYTRWSYWKLSDTFDLHRSPDIVIEHDKWIELLYDNRKKEHFKIPLFEIIMDQHYFNGIGNFSRSEILYRTRCSPFIQLDELLKSDLMRNDFFEICRETLNDIAALGGLQHKNWKNPFGVDVKEMNDWIKCYRKKESSYFQKDSQGRKFWFQKKRILDYIMWMKYNGVKIYDTRLRKDIYKYI